MGKRLIKIAELAELFLEFTLRRIGDELASRFSSLSGAKTQQRIGVTALKIIPFLQGFFCGYLMKAG